MGRRKRHGKKQSVKLVPLWAREEPTGDATWVLRMAKLRAEALWLQLDSLMRGEGTLEETLTLLNGCKSSEPETIGLVMYVLSSLPLPARAGIIDWANAKFCVNCGRLRNTLGAVCPCDNYGPDDYDTFDAEAFEAEYDKESKR